MKTAAMILVSAASEHLDIRRENLEVYHFLVLYS